MLSFALTLLASRDYSEGEMLEKLHKKYPNSSEEETQTVIQTLKDQHLLDDERFSENWVRHWKEEGKMSTAMMKQKLFQKKISQEIIQKTLTEAEISDVSAIQTLAQHKWQSINKLDIPLLKKKEKLFRFLLSKGFSFDAITNAWTSLSF